MRPLRALLRRLRTPRFEEVEREERLFYRAYVRPGMTLFDVGANVGALSLLFAELAGDGAVHAFEPAPEIFARLEAAIAAHGNANVIANRVALADVAGSQVLHCYDGPYHPFASLADRPLAAYGVDAGAARRELVPVTTLDAYCQAHGIARIDLLKIDVEGAELQVLRGAAGMLRDRRIACVAFEFGQATFDMGNRPDALAELFEGSGYRLSNLVEGARLFPGGRSAATAKYAMHLAVPR